jgi:predicted ATPase/DNA-binding CsgD family transcriptional regulator
MADRLIEARRIAKQDLPAQLTPLIGREQEVAAVCALLRRPEVRLVTLTGTGGVGKTRLALQVATDSVDDFANGVCFIPLASIGDPELVVPTIARTLELKEIGQQSLPDLLKAYLQDEHLLLLLDNFEQVVTAAPKLLELLANCPYLKLLVTSRAVLHVSIEYDFPIPPLELPDLAHLPGREQLTEYAAVALFIQRAQAIKPDFQITDANASCIAAICTRLDGLPLAIELAAARINLLPPHALLARLEHRLHLLTSGARDVPARQRTLRNTLEWSYTLLDAAEQRLFRRLSIFAGGCTLDALEATYTTLGDDSGQILDGVASLIDNSLLQQTEQEGEEPRLVMLETIREYGLEALATTGEMEVTLQAHAIYYLQLAEQGGPNLIGVEQQRWCNRLEREHANLQAALHWSIERKEAELTLRLSDALWWFWLTHNHLSEGRQWLEKALSGSEGGVTSVRADVLNVLGLLLLNQGDYEQAERRCAESVALYRELGDTVGIAWPLHHLALVALDQGEYTRAHSLFEECLTRFSEAGDKIGRAYSLCHLALLYNEQGEYEKACSFAEDGLKLFRGLEHGHGISEALFCLVKVLIVSQSGKAVVHRLLEECLALARETGDESRMADALHVAARGALSQGDVATARSFIEESLAFSKAKGYRAGIIGSLAVFGQVTAAQGDYAQARAFYEESLTLAREMGFKRLIPANLEGLAAVFAAQGEPMRAARLWGAAEALREAMGMPLPPIEKPGYERSVAAARIQLGGQIFTAIWAEGRTMIPEEVLAAQEPVKLPQPVPREPLSVLPAKSSPSYPGGLTAREVEVLRLVAQGLTDAQIAEQLMLSPRTVSWHLSTIYNKIQVSSRSAATRYAIEQHMV